MTIPQTETCWQAVVDKDARYDGQFVTAVKTTGIYCRPSCPARRPKRENVDFYPLPAAAEAQGFRACKRCNPRSVTLQDEQALRVQQLCDYIQHNVDADLSLEDLSQVVYWSVFHLQRTFKEVMGISPRQYVEAQRMLRFKQELKAGARVTDAALEAGFSSSSRVYSQTEAYLGMSPSTYQRGGASMQIHYSLAESSLGYLLVAMTERGVCALEMGDEAQALIQRLHEEFPAAYIERDDIGQVAQALQAVLAYLQGWQPHLDLPIDIRVTAFQQRVLDELKRIPYGETRSYGEIAQAIGNPKAARAVGQVCNMNPVPIIIPCHRVIRGDGKIEGYAFGTERKKILLDLEQQGVLEVHEA